jgi:cell division septum initiation protein DivIVA
MKLIIKAAAIGAGILALSACNNTPAENAADNLVENTEAVADNMVDNAEAVADNMTANAEAVADNMTDANTTDANAATNVQ